MVPAAACAAMTLGAGEPGAAVTFPDTRLIIEFNDTDKDVGVQLFVDGGPWKVLRLFDPDGDKLLDFKAQGSMKVQGISEMFFESAEPSLADVPLDEFLGRFPEGDYEFIGTTVDGEMISGLATFTHAIPDGPVLLSPEEDSEQDPDDTVVSWLPVADPEGSRISAYQVIVTQDLKVLPKRTFSVHVPADVFSVTVPPEFLVPGAAYEFEVLAIEEGGNQTLSAGVFTTKR
jgi:hypothetical protein